MSDIIKSETSAPSSVWYAIRTFNCQEMKLSAFLKEKGKTHFIPMTYAEKKTREGKVKRVLVPVVHNLLFLKKEDSQKQILQMLDEFALPVNIFRQKESSRFCEITDREMQEFRALCDPEFEASRFITPEEAEAKPGKQVRIIHGPFAGMTGKLHRVRNNYYFIKSLVGVGVMMRISRWYCTVISE